MSDTILAAYSAAEGLRNSCDLYSGSPIYSTPWTPETGSGGVAYQGYVQNKFGLITRGNSRFHTTSSANFGDVAGLLFVWVGSILQVSNYSHPILAVGDANYPVGLFLYSSGEAYVVHPSDLQSGFVKLEIGADKVNVVVGQIVANGSGAEATIAVNGVVSPIKSVSWVTSPILTVHTTTPVTYATIGNIKGSDTAAASHIITYAASIIATDGLP